MNKTATCFCYALFVALSCLGANYADEPDKQTSDQTTNELDAYWAEVSRCVGEGDFVGYSATCHPQGILVSGTKKSSYPLAEALAKWKPDFENTQAKRIKASVEFRFSQRFHDQTTAHETGIFRYASEQDGKETVAFINFEGLLQKSKGGWKIMMEYQKSVTSEAEWNGLAPKVEPKKEK